MKIKFWGVRGSIPSPLLPSVYERKVREILKFAVDNKLSEKEDINEFIKTLPMHLSTIFGGNSACVTVENNDTYIILDAGSGIRKLGNELLLNENITTGRKPINIIFSHTHLDHIIGLPFFAPLYRDDININFYSVHDNLNETLEILQKRQFFPVAFDKTDSKKEFYKLEKRECLKIGSLDVSNHPLHHPNVSYAYRIEDSNGNAVIYSTDGEYKKDRDNSSFVDFYKDAKILIFDAMYSLTELETQYEGFGHSTSVVGVDFAVKAGVKTLVLFHHDPDADEVAILETYNAAKIYREMNYPDSDLEIIVANEGLELEI